jgi:hypothetical protein
MVISSIFLLLIFLENVKCYNIISSGILNGQFTSNNTNSYLEISNLDNFNIDNFSMILTYSLNLKNNDLDFTLFSYQTQNDIISITLSYTENSILSFFNFNDYSLQISNQGPMEEIEYNYIFSYNNGKLLCDGYDYNLDQNSTSSIAEISNSNNVYKIIFFKNNQNISEVNVNLIYIFNTSNSIQSLNDYYNYYSANYIVSGNSIGLWMFNTSSEQIIPNLVDITTPLYTTQKNNIYINIVEDIEIETMVYQNHPYIFSMTINSYISYGEYVVMLVNNIFSLCIISENIYYNNYLTSQNIYLSNNKIAYNFSCYINMTESGEYPMFISFNFGLTFYDLKRNLSVISYENLINYEIPSNITNNVLPSNNNQDLNSQSIYILIGVGAGFFVIIILYLIYKIYPIQMSNYLTRIDLLDLTSLSNSYVEVELKRSNEIDLGPRRTINKNSSVITGLLTVGTIVFTIFLSYAYLYETISNNTDINITGGLVSSNNNIPIEKSYLNVTTNFKNFYGNCLTGWQMNTNIGNLIMNEIMIDGVRKDCIITYSCINCQIDVINGLNLVLTNMDYIVFYDYLIYEININSYDNVNSTVLGNTEYFNDQIYTSINGNINSTIISLSATPTVYQYFSNTPSTGFILDYQEQTLGSLFNFLDYNELIIPYISSIDYEGFNLIDPTLYTPEIIDFTSTILGIYTNFNSTASVNYKITRNPSYIFITYTTVNSALQIISSFFALSILPFTVMRLIINIITKRPFRKCGFRLFCMKNSADLVDHTNRLSSVSIAREKEIDIENPLGGNIKEIIVNKKRGASIEMVIDKDGVSRFRDSISMNE